MSAEVKIELSVNDRASDALRDVRRQLEHLADQAEQTARKGSMIGEIWTGALRQVGAGLMSLAGTGLSALMDGLGGSISLAADMQSALSEFAGVAGDALGQAGVSIKQVRALALQLGADTQFGAGEAVAAMIELAKGGVAVESIMTDATKATLDLAAATGLDLAPAATILAKQLGVWAAEGLQAAEAADLLVAAANASTVSVEELALGLANVGGTARTAGLSFEETVQTVALISPLFSSAADAGTSLKTFISRLIPTTQEATDMMIALGLATEDGKSKFFDASGAFVGMEAAAGLLAAAVQGLSEEEKLLALNTIFGSDAIRAAAAIAEAGAEGFVRMGQAMDATGGAAQAAAARQQGYNAAIEQLKSGLETLGIVIGDAMLPALTEMALSADDVIGTITAFASAVLSSEDPLRTLAEQLGISGAQVDQFRAMMASAMVTVQQVMTDTGVVVQQVLTTIEEFWAEHGADITAFAQATWSQISSIVSTAIEIIAVLIEHVATVGTWLWDNFGDELSQIASTTWTTITSFISGVLDAIAGLLRAALAALKGDWAGAWVEIQGALGRAKDALVAAVTGIKDNIVTIIGGLWPLIQSAWGSIVDNAGSLGRSLINGIRDGVISAASGLARSVADAAARALDDAKRALGIQSPSKVAMAEVGMPLGQGVLLGVGRELAALPALLRSSVMASQAVAASPVSTSIAVGPISIMAPAGSDERRLAQLVREQVDITIRMARLGRM